MLRIAFKFIRSFMKYLHSQYNSIKTVPKDMKWQIGKERENMDVFILLLQTLKDAYATYSVLKVNLYTTLFRLCILFEF